MLLELMGELGLGLNKTSSCKGGEYHSACPSCGGKDRFTVWPEKNRYWCRQCKKSGDSIQFAREFMGLSFKEACIKAKEEDLNRAPIKQIFIQRSQNWLVKAEKFIDSSHKRLLIDKEAMKLLEQRGLFLNTIKKYSIGWNPVDSFPEKEEWGLEKKVVDGKKKKFFLPKGIVIPIYREGKIDRIKIRKANWKEGDLYGKYYAVKGGSDVMGIYGDKELQVVVLVEAELDGMLVAQEASDLCVVLALGGAQKRPDEEIDLWLRSKRIVLFALDFDEAGKNEYNYWRSHYSNVRAWPVSEGKSPEEAFCKYHVSLKDWIYLMPYK